MRIKVVAHVHISQCMCAGQAGKLHALANQPSLTVYQQYGTVTEPICQTQLHATVAYSRTELEADNKAPATPAEQHHMHHCGALDSDSRVNMHSISETCGHLAS